MAHVLFAWVAFAESKDRFPDVAELSVQSILPDPFQRLDGTSIREPSAWGAQREYLKRLLSWYQYGACPALPETYRVEPVSSEPWLGGRAQRERYRIVLERRDRTHSFEVSLIRPSGPTRRFPVVVKNCKVFFEGEDPTATYDRAAAAMAVERGYVLCKFRRPDVAPDSGPPRQGGVFDLYPEYTWGAIAAWAWATSVVIDVLDDLELADMDRLVVTGHSRGGKTALCAGIYDERIAVTVPNSSGTGGTGSLRFFDEAQRTQRLRFHVNAHAHWWGPEFLEFSDKERRLPFDAHTAKALVAPRALLNPHALQDYWANPYGTEITYRAADLVFRWLGAEGQQGIHWRPGGHAQNEIDWAALFDFADWKLFGKQPTQRFDQLAFPDAPLPVDWSVPEKEAWQ